MRTGNSMPFFIFQIKKIVSNKPQTLSGCLIRSGPILGEILNKDCSSRCPSKDIFKNNPVSRKKIHVLHDNIPDPHSIFCIGGNYIFQGSPIFNCPKESIRGGYITNSA